MNEEEKITGQIQDISDFLTRLEKLKDTGRYQRAIDSIDQVLFSQFNVPSRQLDAIGEELTRKLYHHTQAYSPELTESLARLLAERGDLLYDQHRFEESRRILGEALNLYDWLNQDQDDLSFKRMNQMVWINQQISRIELKCSGD